MAFSDLPTELQNIYLTNIELAIKVFLFCLVICLCVWQIYKLKKNKEERKTPYLLVAYFRGWLGMISYIVLFLSPLVGTFLFYPGFSMEVLHNGVLSFYLLAGIVITVILFVNILFFSGSLLVGFAGYDHFKDKNNQVLNDLERFGGGFKIARNRTLNKILGFRR